ncbi:Dos2-interacting transcription regulator of RNA-Pol-II [Teratosphaeria destructans]|uniref:MMS19 nucleotide excision repair protein n=1 Tax=Teratosphaeria destructans TaxID=418781 RepID=A0A9W7SQ71_9PEZI|nr:Dos2-interacting transcription regulator of RNA-Pol-II [Teratosphaeria destructans]
MSSDITLYLLEVDKDKVEAQRIAASSAKRLGTKELKLIDLITSLEPYINNKDDGAQRAKSVAYLANVLLALPPRVLSGQERHLLCDFVLGRIEGDHEGIGASAKALVALEQLGKWDSATVQKVMRIFIDNTNPLRQFKLQTERYAVVQLIDLLMAKYRDAVKQLHESDSKFLDGFITYFEGEKDPRNLMIIFSLLRVPMTEWDVHAFAQDLFDSVFNYFPITFKPPPDDPYGITAQDLKDRLRDCIAANSDFAPHAFPHLLDKLDSTSMNTKRDVLQTIQACIVGYGADYINLYSVSLWDALKFEVLNVQEEDLALESLKALQLIAAKFTDSLEGPLIAYLRPIIKECNEHLEDAPTKQSEAAGRILHAVASAGPIVADKIANGVLPVLFSLYKGSESITKRRGLLETFSQVAAAYSDMTSARVNVAADALRAHSSEAVQAMVRALVHAPKSEVSFRLVSLSGLAQLTSIPKVLSDEEIVLAVDTVTEVVLHERVEGHGDIRSQAVKALIEMANNAPSALRDRTIPAFMVELPDVPTDALQPTPVLEALAQLSTEREIFDTVVVRLKNKFIAARHQRAPTDYQRALLLGLLYAFTFGSPVLENGIIREEYFTEYAEPVVVDLVRDATGGRDASLLDVVGRLANVMLRPQGVHFQSTVYTRHADWLSAAAKSDGEVVEHVVSLAPFTLYYYAALRAEVVDAADIVASLQAQARVAMSSSLQRKVANAVLRHISLFVNKFANPKAMQATLQSAGLEVEALLSRDVPLAVVDTAFAVVKALLVQGKSGSLTTKYIQSLLSLLANADKSTARRFATLLAPDDILSKENHCLVSGLYRQKVFGQAVPPLTESIRTADLAKKPNYVIALLGILRWLPYSILEPSLASLGPPLLQALDLTDTADHEIKASALCIFESVLLHDSAILAEHTASLITRLLNLTSTSSNNAIVRARALQCLALVPKQLKREAVVPYRRQVVKRLMPCLDDAKRVVRSEAVRCRTGWLGIDDGNDDED